MKICFVSGVISRSGGTERVGTIVANELCKRGYDVYILSFWNQGEPHYNLDERIEVKYLLNSNEGKLYRTYLYPIIKLRKFLKKNNIDILIDIDTSLTLYSSFAKIGTKCKLISWEHFNYWTMMTEKKRIWAKKCAKIFVDKLVVLTDEDLQAHVKMMGFNENKVLRIYNPSPFELYDGYSAENNTFLAVGRLSNQKGFDLLIRSWELFEKENKEWKLQIVGSGEEEDKLKKLILDLGLKNIEMINHTKTIEHYYKRASCYVLSSRYEGFPMVILEAESFGLPIIAFDCKTGPSEMIDNDKNGFLVEDGNIEELAKAMIKFACEKENVDKFSDGSKKIVSKLTIKNIGLEWEKLIIELLTTQ